MVRIVWMAISGRWASEGGPDSGVGEVSVADRFERASVSVVSCPLSVVGPLDCNVLCLLNVADRWCLVCLLCAVDGVCVLFAWSVSRILCGIRKGVLGQICLLDIVGRVVLKVLDFPSFFAGYPSEDAASESVDGSVGDKVGDDYLVSCFNRFFWSWWGEIFGLFRFSVMFRFVDRPVWRGWRVLFDFFFFLLLMIRVSCLFPVGYALFDAVDRVLKRKCVADLCFDMDVANGRVQVTPASGERGFAFSTGQGSYEVRFLARVVAENFCRGAGVCALLHVGFARTVVYNFAWWFASDSEGACGVARGFGSPESV